MLYRYSSKIMAASSDASACDVLVYVYDAATLGPCGDWNPARATEDSLSFDSVFGPRVDAGYKWLRATSNEALAIIYHHRLHHSRCRTRDPARADLFFIPVLTRPKRMLEWLAPCKSCRAAKLLAALPHLSASTAPRHFVVGSKEHPFLAQCTEWWAHPVGLLRDISRISHSPVLPNTSSMRAATAYMAVASRERMGNATLYWLPGSPQIDKIDLADGFYDADAYPHMFGAPMPSNVHVDPASNATLLPWMVGGTTTGHPRAASGVLDGAGMSVGAAGGRSGRILISYLGAMGTHVHGDIPVRRRIEQVCRAVKDSVCKAEVFSRHYQLLDKLRATFCLEPGGDSPFRRSLADSLALGCIPVLFNEATDHTARLLWGDEWRVASRILVPRDAFLNGSYDLVASLQSVPEGRVRAMQGVIVRHVARRFQLSLRDDPGDSLSGMLRGILTSRQLTTRGTRALSPIAMQT